MFSRADVRMSDNVLTDNFLIATNPNPGQQQWVDIYPATESLVLGFPGHLLGLNFWLLNLVGSICKRS